MIESEQKKSFPWQDYVAVAARRRHWFLLPVFFCWLVVFGATWLVPARYRSEATVLIEQQSVPQQYVAPNITTDMDTRLQTMTQNLLSRTRLERLVETYRPYGPVDKSNLDEQIDALRSEVLVSPIKTNPAANHRVETTAVSISYAAPAPSAAQQITSQLTSLFIEENLQQRQQQSEQTTQFLGNQLEEARKDLATQEKQLADFKSKYLGQLPEQTGSNLQILSGLQARLQAQNDAVSQAKQQKVYLESLRGQYTTALQTAGDGKVAASPAALQQELAKERSQLTDLSSRYTEKHPDVVHLKEQISQNEAMQKKMDAELAAPTTTAPKKDVGQLHGDPQTSSALMKVESDLKMNEAELVNRQKSMEELEGRMNSYQGRLNASPLREQELSSLTRDYDQSLANYQSLLAKKMQSELASNLEKRQQGEQFQLIEPPTLPKKPESPDRLKLSLLGIAAGIVIGFLFAAGSELLDDRIYGELALKDVCSAPVMAEIPAIQLPVELVRASRQRRREWMFSAIALVVMVAGNLVAVFR